MFKSILLCLGLAASANALDTPTSSSIMDFSGGLNTMNAPIYLQPNESPDLMNVVIDEPLGALQQRKGYLLCGHIPSGLTATNLFEFTKSDGSHSLIVTDNISIWSTPDCSQWTTIVTGLNQLFIPRFATINDRLWMVNGSTWTSTWDGTTFTRLDGSTSSRPLAPKGRYITNWKNRVWIASPPTDPSAIAFNSLTDPLGTAIDPAVSTNAWSSLNVIYFGKNDGSPIYGVYPYKDNLMVFKERSVWRLLWESEFNLQVVKSVSTIGSKFQDSIVEMDDGTLRYVGTDGVFGYSGDAPVRMSTKITPNFYAFKQPSRAEQSKIWDTPSDWVQGSLVNATTSWYTGSVSLSFSSTTELLDNFSDGNYTSNPIWTPGDGSNYWGVGGRCVNGTIISGPPYSLMYCPPSVNDGIRRTYTGEIYTSTNTITLGTYISSFTVGTKDIATGYFYDCFISSTNKFSNLTGYCNIVSQAANATILSGTIKVSKFDNGAETVLTQSAYSIPWTEALNIVSSVSFDPNNIYISISTGTYVISSYTGPSTVYKSSYHLLKSISPTVTPPSGGFPTFAAAFVPFVYSFYSGIGGYKNTGTFTTQITTATGISQWGIFDALSTPNGQSITYDIRTATSVYNLGLKSYRSITPGAVVSTNSTEGFAQIRANLSTTDNGVTPLLDKLALNWITGDTSLSTIKGIVYKSRYWLVGSTQPANQYNDTTLVESKPPLGTYTLYNTPMSAMTLWNGNLYAAISNTDKIVRMDYGTSDDGVAIASNWSSRDQVYENPVKYKSINKAILDYVGTATNLNIGLSPDSGGTWQDKTLTTTVGPRKTSVLYYDANMSGAFRTRITHNTIDSNYLIYGFHTTGSMSEFIGN